MVVSKMEKNKRWQIALIITVLLLTLYNILPTIFYYIRPLDKTIDAKEASYIAREAKERVNRLEQESIDWVHSFASLLKIKVKSIEIDKALPQEILVTFPTEKEALIFKKYLPRAGFSIPFYPAKLSLAESAANENTKTVAIQRQIPIHFNDDMTGFSYTPLSLDNKEIAPLHLEVTKDRLSCLAKTVGGVSDNAKLISLVLNEKSGSRSLEYLQILSTNILSYANAFSENSSLLGRFFASFTQGPFKNKGDAVDQLIVKFDQFKEQVKAAKVALASEEKDLVKEGQFLDAAKKQELEFLEEKESELLKTTAILRKYAKVFASGATPLTLQDIDQLTRETTKEASITSVQSISVQNQNPLIERIEIDWNSAKIRLFLHSDIVTFVEKLNKGASARQKEAIDQLVFNEIARLSREASEIIAPGKNSFEIALNKLQDAKSLLVYDLKDLAKAQTENIKNFLKKHWAPSSLELAADAFPIVDADEYKTLSPVQQNYCLVISSPLLEHKEGDGDNGFKNSSVYIIAKGLQQMIAKYSSEKENEVSLHFFEEIKALARKLQMLGFAGYPGTTYPLPPSYASDYIFESENYYLPILQATKEKFSVYGNHRFAILEFSNLKQRIHAINAIETADQEELLKWRDEYYASLTNEARAAHFEIPAPTKNPLWSNFKLSCRKYFRGDERKILHWGLDLSGGKTVQIELRDSQGRVVTSEADLNQGINELYNRVNKMGLSEVAIRKEGNNITLDFPGSQSLSAKELIKASTMSFHIVNEKFSSKNPLLKNATERFLQEIWNEAVVTNKKDIDSINAIAFNHLYGNASDAEAVSPRSESAKILLKNGLTLVAPAEKQHSSAFNDILSKIAIMRGTSYQDWNYQSHPLMVVFNNYALEGSDLSMVKAGFDPSEGNFLSFEVKGSHTGRDGQKINPSQDLYTWTSVFAKDKIAGTPYEAFSGRSGWRMAMILNDEVVNAPTLSAALKNSGRITGHFTQREIGRLEADLQAGSLTFAPYILSEKNVSPELGQKERTSGIIATIVALALVIAVMCSYYRFAGVIASLAVLFNLLIMWATLQNLGATITLASIAGIILTMGMAVDANVLIFERIREEFALSKRIHIAIQAGYKKAFAAILDSNITTIIAGLVLLNFDSGPVKGFALTLIIGIVSSMFTALFLTRSFFKYWVQNPKNQELKMLNLIKRSNFDFLKLAKPALVVIAVIALLGGFFLQRERNTIFGMDFTGGFALTVEVTPEENIASYRELVENALKKAGLSVKDFEVRELSPSNHLRIFLAKSLDLPGQAFANLPISEEENPFTTYTYETNPRIVWVVDALSKGGANLNSSSLAKLSTHWTSVSGQMSESMQNNAAIGLLIALVCILIYITLRFEFKYAISATLGLAADVLVTLGLIGILHAIGVPVQIDLNTIAALLTIIGYSLNDTIIVFDRIREDVKLMRKNSMVEIINHSLNITLSRTTMTSLTTLVVLIALLAFGGETVFGFALVMAIGVIVGTLSTFFVASFLLLIFQRGKESHPSQASKAVITAPRGI